MNRFSRPDIAFKRRLALRVPFCWSLPTLQLSSQVQRRNRVGHISEDAVKRYIETQKQRE